MRPGATHESYLKKFGERRWYRPGRPAISTFKEDQPAHKRLKRKMERIDRRFYWDRPITELAARCVINHSKTGWARKRKRNEKGRFLADAA